MVEKLLIKDAFIIDPATDIQDKLDMLITDGRVAAIAPGIKAEDAEVINADGLVCAPGIVDMHVHLRDPGQTYKENIESGCCAAAAGGVTTVACMPNTQPVSDNTEIIGDIINRSSNARTHVYPVAAATKSLEGQELTDFSALKAAGAIAISDDGRPISTAAMMDAMKNAALCGLKVLSHCEDLSLVRGGIMNEGDVSRKLGVPGIHRAAEEVGTARDIALSAATGLPVHICHVSTRGSVALIVDAKKRGVPVTGETAPHYFMLTDKLLEKRDGDYRMNPPLRTQDDVNAVIEGLCDGTLTAIATDHAPHSPEDKADFINAPNGVIGLETSLAAGITALVKPGYITLAHLLALMSANPANILGISAGSLKIGSPADVVIFDPSEVWTVSSDRLHGKSKNTPFKGMKLYGSVKTTLLSGRPVYKNGSIV
ncbi:MAG: dihydroorotase [Oscillospiraceae bacterium]|nr:dihydroorotase [Oscillospiraceae bacterium]